MADETDPGHARRLVDALITETSEYLSANEDCGAHDVITAHMNALIHSIMVIPPPLRDTIAKATKETFSKALDLALEFEAGGGDTH
jgi:hypothetical protein